MFASFCRKSEAATTFYSMFGRILLVSAKHFGGANWENSSSSTSHSSNYSCSSLDVHAVVEDESSEEIRRVAYMLVAPSILLAGIAGNVLNLIVLRKPFLKRCTRSFLTALAFSDLSVMLTTIPMLFRLNRYHGHGFETAFFFAHLELFASNSFIAASVLIVVCLTVERYFSVCHPTVFKSIHTRRNAGFAIAWCYVLAVLVSLPLTVLKQICVRKEDDSGCVLWEFEENTQITSSAYWTAYLWLSEFLIRLGPCLVLGVLNVLILRKFRKLAARRTQLFGADATRRRSSRNNGKLQLEKKLSVLLRAIVVLFFVTMTPSSILSLVYSETHEPSFGFQVFRATANNLELANFALNFYVYFLCSKDFRVALAKVLKTCAFMDDDASDADGEVANTN